MNYKMRTGKENYSLSSEDLELLVSYYKRYLSLGLSPEQLMYLLDHYITPNMIKEAKTADLSFYKEA